VSGKTKRVVLTENLRPTDEPLIVTNQVIPGDRPPKSAAPSSRLKGVRHEISSSNSADDIHFFLLGIRSEEGEETLRYMQAS
jgi:hypothetical protein